MNAQTTNELQYYFLRASDLAEAEQAGDPTAIWEAVDDLNLFSFGAKSAPIRARAAAAVAAHWSAAEIAARRPTWAIQE